MISYDELAWLPIYKQAPGQLLYTEDSPRKSE